ncbi:hypothetical protein [Coralloluteibacterium stylophorae]|uniref:Uncharacterized protein n=1 Tax=Coralloluteibacterium stylophorae TaxID=1776034 RepID=A0A8J7VV24_9GAMM|nr:hypothetical protein [Coralloluteibacterium stylophorae]MBS7456378.1 hypothetical protein [Coralloluteibacterium stylophorae]
MPVARHHPPPLESAGTSASRKLRDAVMDDGCNLRPTPRRRARPLTIALLAALITTTGCQGVTAKTDDGRTIRPDNTVADWPLKFVQHNFGVACYSTYGCHITYAGRLVRDEPDDQLKLSSESLGDKYPDNLRGGWLGIFNFPPPAKVRWRSKDGASHEADVDMAVIFADQLIRHEVPREEVLEGSSIMNPDIILEVNDRTINVWMRAFIPMKTPQIPGNEISNARDEPVLVWSRTY